LSAGPQALRRAKPPAAQPLAVPSITADTRKAALLLHAMPRGDRQWLLEQLPEAERASLNDLLAELETLGIPADRRLLDEAMAPVRSGPSSSAPSPFGSSGRADATRGERPDVTGQLRLLEDANPIRLAAVLRDEPPGLIVQLLGLREWPWRERLLAQLGAPKRRQVEERLARRGESATGAALAATALREQLVLAVSQRLRQGNDARRGDREFRQRSDVQPPEWMSRARRVSGWVPWLGRFKRGGVRP
jgi:hypothetical protein